MKKFIFTIQIIALVTLVPAVVLAYLNDGSAKQGTKETMEIVIENNNVLDAGSMIHLVKSF